MTTLKELREEEKAREEYEFNLYQQRIAEEHAQAEMEAKAQYEFECQQNDADRYAYEQL